MQIKYATAKSIGYRGLAKELLNPEINLKYGGKYRPEPITPQVASPRKAHPAASQG